MRLPSLRSETRSALLRMERWREIDGPEIENREAISPAAKFAHFKLLQDLAPRGIGQGPKNAGNRFHRYTYISYFAK